ncbi:MAG: SpoIVB peptidase [Firmicutes bacterium]|nr:SpoIVB peptidase [Bacillota bacterium]
MKCFSRKVILFLVLSFCVTSGVYAEEIRVIPVGRTVGVRIYTDGLLVVGTSEVNGENAAKKSGIKVNDCIKAINGEYIDSSEEFAQIVNSNPDGVTLSVTRDNQDIEINAVPVLSDDNVYRLGLWVRDSTAGIGTVTYFDPASGTFAALGHSINDVDTGNILSVKSGNILNCDILSVTKSAKGSPGEINGTFDGEKIGDLEINSQIGIFGKMTGGEFADIGGAIPVAAKEQIHEGDAYIISDALGDENNQYSVKIDKITNDAEKSLVIEITDQRLIEGCGGIVQGMSGSPIIQNGRLVGAVTHVFVNNPLKGYGALAENMIDMSSKIAD